MSGQGVYGVLEGSMSLLIHSARGGEEAGWRVYHKLNASPEVRDRNQRGEEESKGKITFVYVGEKH